jgi:hypothetical protein
MFGFMKEREREREREREQNKKLRNEEVHVMYIFFTHML